MSFVSEGVAVVTGAGSGIGRALALRLAEMGSAVALADVDEAGMMETVSLLGERRAAVSTHVVDVADEEAMRNFADDVVARYGRVTLLINNAGVALYGNFEEIALEDFRWLMSINFWGMVYGVKYFLPVLRRQPRGHIANLSSVFGMVAPPGQCAYATSKFAVRGFTEALRHELAGSNVGVSVVHPAGVKTSIARRARLAAGVPETRKTEGIATFARLATSSPERAAERILRGVERRQQRILIGAAARVIDVMQRIRPASYWKLMEKRYNLTP
jgi:NAD(P)-dependent dehydrogenase (short-subunit alcohol dehydrogenase family)